MPRRFAIAAGPNSGLSCLICAASILTGQPLYLPAAFAFAMPSRCRSSMISRSHVVTPARIVSMSLLVGLRVSSRSPPMDSTTRPMPRFDSQQLGCAARQPVRLGDGQHVALAHEGETLGKLHPLG